MVYLVLTLCLIASPSQCRDERPLLEGMSVRACVMQGQHVAEEWLEDHPKWMLSRWRCEKNIPREEPS